MNLVLSGPIDDALTRAVGTLVRPVAAVNLHARAIRFEGVDATPAIRASVAAMCDQTRVDHAFVDRPPGFENYGLLAMDMDSTLITIECIDEIADFAGKKKEVAAITEAAMRGEIKDFAESLRRRVAMLVGIDATVLQKVFEERLRLSDGAERLLGAARKADVYTVLVSGGFSYFTDRLVQLLQFDAGYANRLEIQDGKLTGRLIGPVFGPETKMHVVGDLLQRLNQPRSRAIVIGDGSNDIPMMQLVEHSVAYFGKPSVVAAAAHAVRHGSLNTVADYFA